MTVSLARDPRGAAAASYDLLVVGGGFYGAMLTLEAARRGLSVLLVERDDFGGATSWNSLRIVHGGLRYLQSLDFSRYRESVAERPLVPAALSGSCRAAPLPDAPLRPSSRRVASAAGRIPLWRSPLTRRSHGVAKGGSSMQRRPSGSSRQWTRQASWGGRSGTTPSCLTPIGSLSRLSAGRTGAELGRSTTPRRSASSWTRGG